jgi:hypothetical protein
MRGAERHELAADLDAIARRGVKTLFVFSARDRGLEYFQMFGEPVFRLPHVQEHMRYIVVDGAGHSFRPVHAQESLRALLVEFVKACTVQTS